MAPVKSADGASIFEGWEKWQIALAVGAPVCLGLAGLWYYNRSKDAPEQKSSGATPKPGTKEKPFVKVKPTSQSEATVEETALATAQEYKNNGNKSFKAGKYAEAIQFYTMALETCPPSKKMDISTFYHNRAAAYEKLNDLQKVVENCTEAIKLNGKYAKALNRRANAAEKLGELQMSLEDVTAVCILEGFQNQATLQMADRVLKCLGKEKAKDAVRKKKPGMPSKHVIKTYFASFTQDPVQVLCNKGISDTTMESSTSGDTVQVTEGGSNEETSPSEPAPESNDSAQSTLPPQLNGDQNDASVFKTVLKRFQQRDYEALIPLCGKEAGLEPHSRYRELALLLRGTMFYLTAQADLAHADFNSLLKDEYLDKKIKVNALIKRGSLLINKDQQTAGLEDFAKAARIDPQNSDIFHHRGHQNIQIDRLDDAIRDFESSIMKNPDFPNSYVQKSYAVHRRAAAEQSTMKLEKAIKSYEETLKKFPDNADGHALYAQALCDLGKFDTADSEFNTAIKLEPENANTLVQQALLKLQWKQTIDEAVGLIKQAIVLDDKCEYAYEVLGTIEVQRGDMVKAVSLFETAIDLCRTEVEMAHLFSLLHAAKAQLQAAKTLGIPLPSNFSPM